MRYLIVQDWPNTHGNHAGMVHMCRLLVKQYPKDYTMIVKECPSAVNKRSNPILGLILRKYDNNLYRRKFVDDYFKICAPMFRQLKYGDEVFLLEYNWPLTTQYELATYIKANYIGVFVYALTHLTPSYLKRDKKIRNRIVKWDKPIDKHLTLGGSLSLYLQSIGIHKNKISTGFHYVDNIYYKPSKINLRDKLTIIAMGFLQRDYTMLSEIVNGTPNVEWIICRGRKSEVDQFFTHSNNVHIKGFMEEEELREQMDMADVSLNVMTDTVGSNVITTSMAMGLVMVVSDVGSIRDYCDNSNTLFCQNTPYSFINAIDELSNKNKTDLESMKASSLSKSKSLTIDNIHSWFSSLK